ncbi:hypothetical protein NYP20_17330 [Pseudomonas sp. N3-W]|uniref:Uncharacterized protein n=1 Tax=Pseudomonas fungipugnans TaxID=3024217 RepID=A0ABT6QIF7_9PSED|nr:MULTISPECIES: hypothetical protein [unclassified Pseudomonas]MDI2590666.1 hypothetical protein [Pseudomonas sp. 681]UWF47108.1 hypothetical protein NYP20_17330 [Pseudomonas sp. N3-W]
MPMQDYTAKDLSVFSTIIARAACLRNWGADLGAGGAGPAIEEVQCMLFRESLYVAGNHGEHASIADFFRAFGVSNQTTFIDCLRYSHWLLSTPYVTRTAVTGRSYHGAFSGQEDITLNYAAESLGHIAPLSLVEIAQARGLVTTAVLPAGPQRTLAWFLKKFTGAPALAGLNRPAATAFHYATNFNGIHTINLLDDSTTVHAELKLLRMLAYAHTQNLMPRTTGRVRIGGLKRTCAFCAAWISRFQPWMFKAFEVRIDLPADDTRGVADGAGNRPSNVGEAGFGLYVQTLFNGGANSNCLDVAAHADDDAW